ncbi:MAG: tRNA (adenosine(37)-N6)-threonylcarbamoyltransferase complex transferase subunit TsaD, partial [Pseudomonadota bacterium]
MSFSDLDAVAATAGPGLIGGVMVGLTTAKAISIGHGLPLVAVNHLEGHALSPRLTEDAPFPYLLLLVSGGHTQLLIVRGVGQYQRLGSTIDDAVGEAFDKTAKLMGLGYPGGPNLERAAKNGDPKRFPLPRPLAKRPGCDFSFSGLKTAVRLAVADIEAPNEQDVADLAASFQATAAASLSERSRRAMEIFRRDAEPGAPLRFVVAGGVAANGAIRAALSALCANEGFALAVPPPALCTDNGAMIAWAGAERLRLGLIDDLSVAARPRWPLDPEAAAAMNHKGRKGAKA